MPPRRPAGSADSATRTAILDATERVMMADGYAAVTSRSVAAEAGIHAGNVHYYFPSIDDLFLALLSRGADRSLERIAAALGSPQPFKALWNLQATHRGVSILDELMAAARHRKPLRAHVTALAKTAHRMQIEAIRALMPQYDLDEELFPPELVAAMLQGTALLVMRQQALDVPAEHENARAAAEALIDHLESRRDLNKGSSR